LVLNKFVTLQNIESEKDGRMMEAVYIGNVHLNNLPEGQSRIIFEDELK
jgi:hypothetical protein